MEVTPDAASYVLADDGPPVEIRHHGDPVTVTAAPPQTRPIAALPARPRPLQPPGREPWLRTRPDAAGRP